MSPPRQIEPPQLLQAVIRPALASCAAAVDEPRLADPRAAALLVAIAIQESDLRYLRQYPTGPARSWWQIEPLTGGLAMRRATAALGEPWRRLLHLHGLDGPLHETLTAWPLSAAVAARLLLWHDPRRLPDLGAQDAAWDVYIGCWRPGRPHAQTWPRAYAEAMDAMQSTELVA